MRTVSFFLFVAALAGCDGEPPVTEPVAASAKQTAGGRYRVVAFSSSLGGNVSAGTSINERGWIAGFSNLPGDTTRHAALWRDGRILDLRTLGGPNSNVQWPGQNDEGMVVGIAETRKLDPNQEEWSCSAFFPTVTHHVCRGFVWYRGEMKALAPFGGTHSFATGINDDGQVVGWAETTVRDPTCNAPQVLQFRAVQWDAKNGGRRQLRPLHGDSTSAATAINDLGQVVGISGDCDIAVGQLSARHAVIWEDGKVKEIGDLGGDAWHTPMAISDRGVVVGFSNPAGVPGITFQPHAFRWTKEGGIEDLELLEGHDFSQAFGVNRRGQIVGRSCGPAGCRAVLWENGKLKDLNNLIGRYDDVLTAARHINDEGRITGNFVEGSSGKTLTFVAIPMN